MINHYSVIRTFIKETGQEKGTVSGQMAMASLSWLEKIEAAQHRVHLTALRRGLAVSILFNVVLLAVVSFIIGGN